MPVKKLEDGTSYVKATYYKGGGLKGKWQVYRKIDGVRAIRGKDGFPLSRNSKPLNNIDHLTFNDAEIFSCDFNTTIGLVMSKTKQVVTQDMVYELSPPDPRLCLTDLVNPTEEELDVMLMSALAAGDEGLVLRQDNKWLKHVPTLFADVRVIGYKEGKGRHAGTLGSLLTNHGNIGTGFSDEQRAELWKRRELGIIVQASYRELTKDNIMRFPAFERVRPDKDEESFS